MVLQVPQFPWLSLAGRNGLVVDTGVLLIHAALALRGPASLGQVMSDVPRAQRLGLGELIDQTMRAFRAHLTPEVLAEFQALAQSRLRLGEEDKAAFLRGYSAYAITEQYVPWERIVRAKSEHDAWTFSYTDTSLVLAARDLNAPLLTTDRRLRALGARMNVQVLHVYEDYYLHL